MAEHQAHIEKQTLRCLASLVPQHFLEDGETDTCPEFDTSMELLITNKEAELPKENVQKTRCNKSLEPQEIAYCCRDCETDPTCVLCAECFEHGTHSNHLYRMITSAGGCCDCGDPEAWTSSVHCSLHKPQEAASRKHCDDPLSVVPPIIVARTPAVFTALLKYCQALLYWQDESKQLLEELKIADTDELLEKDSYQALLFNDEVHSYDDVIFVLTQNVGLGHVEAIGLTTQVDKVGRARFQTGTKEQCEKAKEKINTNVRQPLEVMVLHSAVVAHQMCALYVLSFLEKLTKQSAGLCRLLSEAFLSVTEEGHSILDKYFLMDNSTWKGSATKWQSLILHSIYMDLKRKEDLGIALTRNYNLLLKNFNREKQLRDVSATAMSVQLFTTPSLTRVLIIQHDLLSVLFGTMEDLFESCQTPKGKLAIANKPDMSVRIAYLTLDLRYVLRTQPPVESEWTAEFRDKFIRGFKVFLRVLAIIEDVDAVKRQRAKHVSREIEWEPTLNLWCLLQPVVLMMEQWCQSDVACLKECVLLIKQACLRPNKMTFTHTEPPLISCFVGEEPISIHCPVPRLLAGLLTAADRYNLPLGELLQMAPGDPVLMSSLLILMEKSLRCLVFSGQVHSGMWKRNGYSVLNQVFNYQYHFCQKGMFDKDLLMVKSAAVLLEPHVFLHALLHKYRLQRWFEGCENPVEGRDEPRDDAICFLTAEAEEMVYLLITVLGEHYFPGVGRVQPSDCLKRELIHSLYISPYSHKDLLKHHKHYEEKDITPVLGEVADYQRGAQSRKGMYKLKPECEKEHSLFFYHYTRVEQSKAEDIQRRKVKAAGGPSKLGAIPPPSPPPLCEPYKGILGLIHSPVLWQILIAVFSRAVTSSKLWSDKLLNETLYLCGLMLLQEDASGSHTFSQNSTEPFGSQEISLLELLEKLLASHKAEENRPVLAWILQQLRAVQQAQLGTPVDAEDVADGPLPEVEEKPIHKAQSSSVAAEKRKRIMDQMARQQKIFLQKHKMELDSISPSQTSPVRRLSSSVCPEGSGELCAVGPQALRHPPVDPSPFTCNICQGEGLEGTVNSSTTPILGTWVQRSAVLKVGVSSGSGPDDGTNFLSCARNGNLGIFANSCGHTMHYECWKKYQESKVVQERHRLFMLMAQTVEWLKGEFLCPLCEFHCNSILPVLPVRRQADLSADVEDMTVTEWIQSTVDLVRAHLPSTEGGSGQEEHQLEDMDIGEGRKQTEEEAGPSSRMPRPAVRVPGPGCGMEGRHTLSQLFPKYFKRDQSEKKSSVIEGNGTAEFAQTVFTTGYCTDPNDLDERVPIALWNTCAFTMTCFEHSHSLKGKSVLSSLRERDLQRFEGLIRTVMDYTHRLKPSVLATHCQYLLNVLALCEPITSTPMEEAAQPMHSGPLSLPDILSVDPFMLMVNFHFALSAFLHAVGAGEAVRCDYAVAVADQFVVRVAFCIKLLQYLSSLHPVDSQVEDRMELDASENDSSVAKMWHRWRQVLSVPGEGQQAPEMDSLYEDLQMAVLPFLQSAALFYHCVTGVHLPEDTSPALLSYLALPSNPCQMLAPDSTYWKFVERWAQHKNLVGVVTEKGGCGLLSALPRQPSLYLMSLPQDYSEVIKWATEYSCAKVGNNSWENSNVFLCLLCGQMLCSSSYCCRFEVDGHQLGSFSHHARSCGAGYGMGLWIMKCQVALINVADVEVVRGCFLPAPYLDSYGDTDIGLKHGRPLTLSRESQQEFLDLWLSHDYAGRITKELDQKHQLLAFPWRRL